MTPERVALDFVRMLPTSSEAVPATDVGALRRRWGSLSPESQLTVAATLAYLVGSLAEMEAHRRSLTRDEALRQIEADISSGRRERTAGAIGCRRPFRE